MRDPYKTLIIKYQCYQIIFTRNTLTHLGRKYLQNLALNSTDLVFFKIFIRHLAEQQKHIKYCFPREKEKIIMTLMLHKLTL